MRKILLFIFIVAGIGSGQAQQMLGLAGNNYSGTHGIFLNPASVANSRNGFYFDLATVQVGAANNYLKLPLGVANIGGFELDKNNLDKRDNARPKFASAGGQASALSFMVKMSPLHSFAFTNRVRFGLSANNVSSQLANIIAEGTDNGDGVAGNTYRNIAFNMSVNAYKETGLTYARVVEVDKAHTLKAGLTINRLHGITAAYFNSRDADFSISEKPDPQQPTEDRTLANIENIDLRYGYIDPKAYESATDNPSLGSFFGKGLPGKGWGFNLGATYEKLEDTAGEKLMDSLKTMYSVDKSSGKRMKNNYKYRLGVALMDVGSIRYSGDFVKNYDISRADKTIVADSLSGGAEDIAGVLNNALDVTPGETSNTLKTGLATALHVNLDYHIKGKLYVNTVWVQSLRGKNALGMRRASLLAITPRLEMRWFEFALPVAIAHNYSRVVVGAYVKLGVFHIGSDNVAGALGLGKTYGTDAYAGVSIPVFARNKQAKAKTVKSEGVPTR